MRKPLNLNELIEFVQDYIGDDDVRRQLVAVILAGERMKDAMNELNSSSSYAELFVNDWNKAIGADE